MPNMLPVNHLRLVLDTRKPLQVETSAEILSSLAQSLRNDPDIGNRAGIEIVEVKQGSWWAEIAIITGTLVGAVGEIANSANNLASEIREGRTPFARSIAAAANEGEAEMCELITAEQSLEIPKQAMKALAGMVPNENFYGKGPLSRPKITDFPISSNGDAAEKGSPEKGSSFVGMLVESNDGPAFRLKSGSTALINDVKKGLIIPNDTLVEIQAFVKPGSRGGIGDPRLEIVDWNSIDDRLNARSMSSEKAMMIDVMYETPDDEKLKSKTKTYIGHFVEQSGELFLETRDDVRFGILNRAEHPLEIEFAVQAQRFEHPEARFDWLRVMDLFDIEED